MPDSIIRPASRHDLAEINAIYNHYVLHSTCTFQTEPATDAERLAWFENHGREYPIIVAQVGNDMLGWASLSRYHTRCAYRHTVENSVYVRHDRHRLGVGRALLAELIRLAEQVGHHSILALVAADQPASLTLHERQGFDRVAHLHEVGFKFDRWIDVIFMQRMLASHADRPAAHRA